MDVMRGLGEHGEPTRLAGVENLMLHFTPYAEDWSKLPVIVSGEGSYVTDDKGRSYIDGLAGLFTTQVGHGRAELAEVAAKQMKELGFFPNWSFQHPRSLELAHKIAEIAPGTSTARSSSPRVRGGGDHHQARPAVPQGQRGAGRYKIISRDVAYHGTTMGALSVTGLPSFKAPFEPLPSGFFHVKNTQQDPEGAATR
jgi:adenosylmethionine-8-amino-7-oxononanoate aminotransferase